MTTHENNLITGNFDIPIINNFICQVMYFSLSFPLHVCICVCVYVCSCVCVLNTYAFDFQICLYRVINNSKKNIEIPIYQRTTCGQWVTKGASWLWSHKLCYTTSHQPSYQWLVDPVFWDLQTEMQAFQKYLYTFV